jgi:acetolactate synthase I/II/III large subunit
LRLADYVANALADHGIRDVFMVTGGGAMHLNDAIGRCDRLHYVCCHHEQACSIAAQGYYRLTNRLAAVNVTTGPGGTNAITGVFGAWVDSLGMVVVSGQVKWETLVRSTGIPLRQLGDQEVDIVRLVESITKYAVMITDPSTVRYHVEKAIHLARTGRPGPVWLDIPMNVQGANIEPETLRGFDPAAEPGQGQPKRGPRCRCRTHSGAALHGGATRHLRRRWRASRRRGR